MLLQISGWDHVPCVLVKENLLSVVEQCVFQFSWESAVSVAQAKQPAVKFALKYPSKRWFKSIRTETLTWGRGGTYGPQLKNFTRPCIDSECTGLVMCFPSIKKDLKILFFKVDSFQIERLSPAKSGIKHRFKQFDKIYETFFQNADL